MSKSRSNVMSLLALILAAAAWVNTLLPAAPAANAAPRLQDTPAQPVDAASVQALAAITPSQIGYDGLLRDAAGAPLASGTYSVTFRIYDSLNPTAPAIWAESHPTLTVRSGVLLGNGKLLPGSQPLVNAFNGTDRYLGVRLQGFAEMIPRQRFASVPYAMGSERAASLSAPDGDPLNAVYVSNDGNIGIGTTSPTEKLQVMGNTYVGGNIGVGANMGVGGSVGIGTANPERRLHVAGDARVDGWFFMYGTDFWMGANERGDGGRAMVHDVGDSLVLNYANDFPGGTYVDSNLTVGGNCYCRIAVAALNTGQQTLASGDIVALRGITQVDFQIEPLLNVDLANGTDTIIGVVQGGAELSQPRNGDGTMSRSLVPTGETAQPGSYVTIITNGMAQVKTNGATSVKQGATLTLGTQPGMVQTLEDAAQTLSNAAAPLSIVGTALENAQPGQQRVWVLVNPR